MARPDYYVLCRESALIAVESLMTSPHPQAAPLACMILDAIPDSINDGDSIRLPVIPDDMHALLRRCGVRTGLVTSVRHPRYVAVYRHPEDPTVPDVIVRTFDRPRSRRTLSGPGGRRRYVRVSSHRMTKEELPMAARQTRTRAKSRKATAAPVDELDDLEALEELEDLEDVEDEAPAKPARRSRAKAKPAPEPEPDEDEDDEDAEDEDGDEYDDMNTAELRAACKDAGIKSRGMNADAMREALREDGDEDDADEDDEEEEDEAPAPKRRTRATTKPAAKPATKAKASATKRTPPAPRAIPSGKYSVNDIAEAVGTSGLNVRQWLRRNDIEKDDETGRYIFGKKEFDRIVKKMSA